MLRSLLARAKSSSVKAMTCSGKAGLSSVARVVVGDEQERKTRSPARTVFLRPDDPDSVRVAADLLLARDAVVIAVPTDTIYGVACLAQSSSAVGHVYRMKGRHEDKPLAICVGSAAEVGEFCKVTVPEAVLDALYPGPVTLIFPRLPVRRVQMLLRHILYSQTTQTLRNVPCFFFFFFFFWFFFFFFFFF
jgi:hypothetical protein